MTPVSREDLAATLGADLTALLEGLASPPLRIEPVHTLPSPLRRLAAFRVELADGTQLKARRLENERQAEMVGRLLEDAGDAFPAALERRGAALLEPWVGGTVLATLEAIDETVFERCGAILGELHRLPVPAWRTRPVRNLADQSRRLREDLALLVEIGAVEPALGERILAIAATAMPDDASLGVVHRDFCADNLLLTAAGDIVAIDNATLFLAPHDFDLARTWVRWPMRPAQAEAFLRGYGRRRSAAGFRRHFPFWATSAVVASAASRHRLQSGDLETPLKRLHDLMTTLASGRLGPWEADG